MRLCTAVVLMAIAALSGCTQTVVLKRPTTVAEYRALARTLDDTETTVVTSEGQQHPLFNVRLSIDSLFGHWNGRRQTIPMTEVVEITGGKNRIDGARQGLKVGALIGAGVALWTSFSPEQTCYEAPCPGTSGFVVQMAASGAIYGVVIGAIRGNRTRYRITP